VTIEAYFDDNTFINQKHLQQDKYLFFQPSSNIKIRLEEAGFTINTSNDFNKFGIYWVGSLGHPLRYSQPVHVLHKLDDKIIEAARQNKIVIILDSKPEGKPFVQETNDCFMDLHEAMFKLELPAFSVVIVDGNEHFSNTYNEFLCELRMPRMVHHIPFFDHTFYFHNLDLNEKTLTIFKALETAKENNVKDFNSLNRNTRIHRQDHLYYIFKNKLHLKGLISGCLAMGRTKFEKNCDLRSVYNSPFFDQAELQKRFKILKKHLPVSIDGDWGAVGPEVDVKCLFPVDIYRKSLLTVTTETCFHENGMFLTEKAYRPIAAGHPFMILGQFQILKHLKEKGYETDFYGLDQSYDNIHNIKDRFFAFHKSLHNWCEMPLQDKIECVKQSIPLIRHNFNLFHSKDLEIESYKKVFKDIVEKYGKY